MWWVTSACIGAAMRQQRFLIGWNKRSIDGRTHTTTCRTMLFRIKLFLAMVTSYRLRYHVMHGTHLFATNSLAIVITENISRFRLKITETWLHIDWLLPIKNKHCLEFIICSLHPYTRTSAASSDNWIITDFPTRLQVALQKMDNQWGREDFACSSYHLVTLHRAIIRRCHEM